MDLSSSELCIQSFGGLLGACPLVRTLIFVLLTWLLTVLLSPGYIICTAFLLLTNSDVLKQKAIYGPSVCGSFGVSSGWTCHGLLSWFSALFLWVDPTHCFYLCGLFLSRTAAGLLLSPFFPRAPGLPSTCRGHPRSTPSSRMLLIKLCLSPLLLVTVHKAFFCLDSRNPHSMEIIQVPKHCLLTPV